MKRKKSLIINALSNWTSLVVSLLIGVFLTPFLISHYGKDGFGIWTLVASFIGYYGLVNLGVTSAVTRYVARYTAQGKRDELNEVVSSAIGMFLFTGGLVVLISIFFSVPLAHFFNVPEEQVDSFAKLVILIGVTTGISFPGSIFSSVITARENYVTVNIIVIVRELLRAFLIVVLTINDYGLLSLGVSPLISTVFFVICSFIFYKKYADDINLKARFFNFICLKELIKYGIFMSLLVIVNLFRGELSKIIIGKYLSLEAIAEYGIAIMLVKYCFKFINSGIGVLLPRFSKLDSHEDSKQLHELFLNSLTISSCLTVCITVTLYLWGGEVIKLWVGSGFAVSYDVLKVLIIGYTFALIQTPCFPLLMAINKHSIFSCLAVIETIFILALSIPLTVKYGLVGAAWAVTTSLFLFKIIIQPIFVSFVTKIHISIYYGKLIYSIIIFTVTIILINHYSFSEYISSLNLLYTFIGIALTATVLILFHFPVLKKHINLIKRK